jgi:hypothetical protein
MRTISIAILIVVLPLMALHAEGNKKDPYYKGMAKEKLLELFPVQYQLNYSKELDREVYIFDDHFSEEEGDSITFYLKGGSIDWWDKDKADPTPEERLAQIRKRSKHSGKTPPMTDTGAEQEMRWKESDRLDRTGRTSTQRRNKSKYGIL